MAKLHCTTYGGFLSAEVPVNINKKILCEVFLEKKVFNHQNT